MNARPRLLRDAALWLVVVVLVNALAQRVLLRWDLTESHRYTLSPATLDILDTLPEAVTVTAWFTDELPPDLAIVRQDLKDMLVEYRARSGGRVDFEFIDPASEEGLPERAREEGVRMLMATTRVKDEARNMPVFMGAVVRMAGRKAVIPVVQRGAALEWTLSSAIQEVSSSGLPTVGFLQGHGEPSTAAIDQLAVALSPSYLVEVTAIYEQFPINERFHSLVILDPVDSFPPAHLQRIEEYMDKGHGVVVAYSTVRGDLSMSAAVTHNPAGLEAWLARQGVQMDPHVLADARCGQVQVMQAGLPAPVTINFPYQPLVQDFGDHPVVNGCDMVLFQFISPLTCLASNTRSCTPLLFSSPRSELVDVPFSIDLRRQWQEADFTAGPQVLGAALEQTGANGQDQRMVVFGNGSFCTGIQAGKVVQLPQGNIDLMVNAIDWVSHRTALLALRGKEAGYRPIEMPDEARRSWLKWMNLLVPMGAVVLFGVLRWWWRGRQRKARMAPDHVR